MSKNPDDWAGDRDDLPAYTARIVQLEEQRDKLLRILKDLEVTNYELRLERDHKELSVKWTLEQKDQQIADQAAALRSLTEERDEARAQTEAASTAACQDAVTNRVVPSGSDSGQEFRSADVTHRCYCGPRECLHPLHLRGGFQCAVQQDALDHLRTQIEQLPRGESLGRSTVLLADVLALLSDEWREEMIPGLPVRAIP